MQKEAFFYKKISPEALTVQCFLCNHNCKIKNQQTGRCKVRQNLNGKLISLVYGSLVSRSIDPIEKKPIFHLMPGSLSYSIATVGCNFRCNHCQNHEISQYPHHHPETIPGFPATAKQIAEDALEKKCSSISYTYIEPTIFFEFAYDTAIEAHSKGIKNIFVSNGYTSRDATKKIAPFLNANNIDLKSFSDKFYREICNAKLSPVLDTISLMKELGVWVEVTTLVIPGLNDSDEELSKIAAFLVSVDPNIPWHVSKFYPTYKMTNRPATPASTLHRAREIGKTAGLKHIYSGNIPGQGGENTICPSCKKILIERIGYQINSNNLTEGKCKYCETLIAGVWA